MTQYVLKHFFYLFLHGALPLLPLPTMKMSAQVLNYQGDSIRRLILRGSHAIGFWSSN
jgi:hypothetical protein